MSPTPQVYVLSDELVTEAKRVLNQSVHELVFAMSHLEGDNSEDALNCLTSVGLNVERIAQMIVDAEKEIAALNKQ